MMTSPAQLQRIDDPAGFGRVAVLLGGESAEREISLMSGQAVHEALLRRGVDARPVDAVGDFIDELRGGFDRVWVALHGRGGEDGSMQGLLEHLGLSYTGSGVLGSAISMDKLRTKRLLAGAGLRTPAYRVLRAGDDFDAVARTLDLPLMIKPAAEGSSIGLVKVETAGELPEAFAAAAEFGCDVFAEAWVEGDEYTAAVLHDSVLPLVRVDAASTFYDYEAKYFSDDTRYVCPCGLDAAHEKSFAADSLVAFGAVGATGWGRVDFMLDEAGQPMMLEVNTIPGMTGHSLVPMAAAQAGIDFDELVWRVLETSFVARGHTGTAEAGA